MKRKTVSIITALLCSLFPATNAELVISEVMARGGNEFADEDGAHPDWIELFNNTSESLDLGNYALTDDEQDLLKWKFPNRPLGPRSYAIVFASGKDRRPEKGNLHANFKLDGSGEYLAAVRIREKKVVSAFDPHFPAAGKGESFGHVTQDDRIDTTSAMGQFTFHIMAAMAELERSLISERTKAGLAEARRRGQRLGRPRVSRWRQCFGSQVRNLRITEN